MAKKAILQSTPSAAKTNKTFSLIGDAKLKQLYSAMLHCRMIDERAHSLFRREPSAIGEATAVGAAIDLRRDDWLVSNELFPSLIKGATLASIVAQLARAKPSRKRDTSLSANAEAAALKILAPSSSAASTLSIAAGLALAGKPGSIVMVFASGRADFRKSLVETMSFAAAHTLPMLVVVPSVLKTGKGSRVMKQKPPPVPWFPIIPVDANDVVAMYRVASESLHKARIGGGPTLIEAVTLPAAKPALKTRASLSGGDTIHPGGPLQKMQTYLAAKGLFSANWEKSVVDKFSRKLDSALRVS